MLITALLVTIVTMICTIDELNFGQFLICAPLVMASLIGLCLGDLAKGVMIGAQLQLVFLGIAGIGAAVPPDVTVGTAVSTALCILTGQGIEVALTIAFPVALAGQAIAIMIRTISTSLIHVADVAAEKENYSRVKAMNLLGIPLFCMRAILIVFPAVYFGADFVTSILNAIPASVLHGLQVAGDMLPALGFGMLLSIVATKRLMPFFFIGFALATFAKISLIGVFVFALSSALVIDYIKNDGQGDKKSQKPALDDLLGEESL